MNRFAISFRALWVCAVSAFLVIAGIVGCSSDEKPLKFDTPEQTAADVKVIASQQLNVAMQTPDVAGSVAENLVQMLEETDSSKFGSHKSVFDSLLTGCRDFQQLCTESAASDQVNAKIDELLSLVAKLPSPTGEQKGAPKSGR
ncbi:MAG: hypothetical protein QF918_04780 [Pirellulaceae bacterium]|nr:hypothetical protein [Pirellulaceae bacterium]MDP6556779.1 hypothetical protein [Pirellulaceae bacterium]